MNRSPAWSEHLRALITAGLVPAIGGGDPDAPVNSLIPQSEEDLRGRHPDELRKTVEAMTAHLQSLHQEEGTGALRSLSTEEQEAFDLLMGLRAKAMEMIEHHEKISEVLRRRPQAVERVYKSISRGLDDNSQVVRMTTHEARDRALRVLDDKGTSAHMSQAQRDEAERQIRRSTDIARRVLVTETEAYRTAWAKLVTDPHPILADEERNAVLAYNEYRAMSETTTAGGFGVPVFIDPSIILTAQESNNPFLQIARQVQVNTNAWKGVSSAGVSWSFDAEATEVSDDSATVAQPVVNVYMARGFIPFSIELGQDYPGFAEEMARLLASGYDELLVDKFTRGAGTGSGEPTGILTSLSANTNVRVTLTTSGQFGSADPYKVWAAVPQKYRRNAAWLMSVNVNNGIRQLGTATGFHAATVQLPEGWADSFFASPAYESPYMPDLTTSTSATIGLAVVGDFSNFVIARRGGMAVELVPTLIGLTSNRPTGQRGWFAYARVGAASVNDLGFRLLVNT